MRSLLLIMASSALLSGCVSTRPMKGGKSCNSFMLIPLLNATEGDCGWKRNVPALIWMTD